VLREEREILRTAAAWIAKETTSIPSRGSEFVKGYQADHAIATMCRALGVSLNGYYARQHRLLSARAQRDAGLTRWIRTIHLKSRGTYGAQLPRAGPRMSVPALTSFAVATSRSCSSHAPGWGTHATILICPDRCA
jgi:hypothetical protein